MPQLADPMFQDPVSRAWPWTLVVVSHVVHYRHHGRLYAYGPYAREIDRWAACFERILIASPCKDVEPPHDAGQLAASNIEIAPQAQTGGTTLPLKIRQLLMVPALAWTLMRTMRRGDAILVRCPGNLGLLGAMLAPLCSRRIVAKYAGQWTAYPGEAWTVRLQRAILRSGWWHGPVFAYASRSESHTHVVPFFSTALTECQLAWAKRIARARARRRIPRLLFVGRLTAAKNVHVLLTALEKTRRAGCDFQVIIVGDGPERRALEAQAERAGLRAQVTFCGGLAVERVLEHYAEAEILVLASESEGWPKAIAEGMAFGLICVGSARGITPAMLSDGRGVVVTPGDADELAAVLQRIFMAPEGYDAMRERASEWATQFSLEAFDAAVHDALEEHWDAPRGLALSGTGSPCR